MTSLFSTEKPFALIRRQDSATLLHLSGSLMKLDRLADIPRGTGPSGGGEAFDTLSILPFHQVGELGFAARSGDEKILTLKVEAQENLVLSDLLAVLPAESCALDGVLVAAPDDAGFADMVRHIIDDEIGNGAGCNFVVPRFFRGKVAAFSLAKALSIFRRLLENEYGAYWTFLFFTGEQYFIGATPERHLSCQGGRVKMNPISGTFRKLEHAEAEALPALERFLADPKETFELLMVVDEELKMMAGLCSEGGQVVGPMVKEMSKLVHTEYVLVGRSSRDVVDMLRESMFAATVVGSPIENACRINHRYQPESRRYYGSALALIGRDADGGDTLDSPITIRMAEIGLDGCFEIGAGATIVHDSDPVSETAETSAKARGMLAALGVRDGAGASSYRLGMRMYGEDCLIRLSARNARLSRFWIEEQDGSRLVDPRLSGKRMTIIDNEDSFTRMIGHMCSALGLLPRLVRNEAFDPARDDADILLLGPGPGDPRDDNDPRMARALAVCRERLALKRPVLGICLGHQIMCRSLGIPLVKKRKPLQGAQLVIDLFGSTERVGFYNTFAGQSGSVPSGIDVSADEETGEIHALRGAGFAGLQFHPESILTTDGLRVLRDVLLGLVEKSDEA